MSNHSAESSTNLRNATPSEGEKWSREKVIREARLRTRELFTDNSRRVQVMLAKLLEEAGWSEDEFIDALCQDVIKNGSH